MLILAITCLGIIAYAGFMNHLFNEKETVQSLPTKYSAQSEMPGWKIYTNTKYNFSFKFPGNFGSQGGISGPATGTVVGLRSFTDPATLQSGSDARFDGFSIFVVTNPGTTFDKYISKEVTAMNAAKYTGMKNPTRVDIKNGVGLVSKDGGQAYYYLPTPDQKTIVVFAYLQAEATFKQTFDKVLSSFQFTQ